MLKVRGLCCEGQSILDALLCLREYEIMIATNVQMQATTVMALGATMSKKNKMKGQRALDALTGKISDRSGGEPIWRRDPEAKKVFQEIQEHNQKWLAERREKQEIKSGDEK